MSLLKVRKIVVQLEEIFHLEDQLAARQPDVESYR